MTCSVETCVRPARARGWCDSHYRRWKRTGSAEGDLRLYVQGDLADRLATYVVTSGDCWEWTGAIDVQTGYGRIDIGTTIGYTHRVAYELHVGPIPDGLVIDHLCRNRSCCNPAHLEPVTNAENIRRGFAARSSEGE